MLQEHVLRLQLNKFVFVLTGGFYRLRELGISLEKKLISIGATSGSAPGHSASHEAGWSHDRRLWSIEEIERFIQTGEHPHEEFDTSAAGAAVDAAKLSDRAWAGLTAAVIAEWEGALRSFSQYLIHHLKVQDAAPVETAGRRLMDDFEAFVNSAVGLDFDFDIREWQAMSNHVRIRDLLPPDRSGLFGQEEDEPEAPVERLPAHITRPGDQFGGSRSSAESAINDAVGFFIEFDRSLRHQFRHI